MKKIVYSVYDLVNEEVALELEGAVKQAIGASDKLSNAIPDIQLSWLGERFTLSVSDAWDSEARAVFEQLAFEECSRVGARLVTPPVADAYVLGGVKKEKKEPRRISFGAATASVITAVVLAVLITFSVTTAFMQKDMPQTVTPGGEEDKFGELDILDRLFQSASLFSGDEQSEEERLNAVLKAYVQSTGDRYARYYTAEEYKQLITEQSGNMCGIGVTVIAGSVVLEGEVYETIEVIYVTPNSPAEKAGVKIGDHIYVVAKGDEMIVVNDIGYSEAVDMMLGEEGTAAEFLLLRKDPEASTENNTVYNTIEISAVREQIQTQSVMYSRCETDASVGIVQISGFDNTTASQLDEAIQTLRDSGCEYFVLDLRNNTGGMLTSVEDCLTYFLNKDDIIIRVKDRSGNESSSKVMGGGIDGYAHSGSGELSEADVGKYKDLKMILLVNGYTASAAELFTANFRDYGLAQIVGTQTYGKGSVQTTISLSRYGIDGALKLTTRFYYPAKGEGFDGVGITPDHILAMSEEAASYHPNLLPDALDNQLQYAIEQMKK